jgi:hypothetical protein
LALIFMETLARYCERPRAWAVALTPRPALSAAMHCVGRPRSVSPSDLTSLYRGVLPVVGRGGVFWRALRGAGLARPGARLRCRWPPTAAGGCGAGPLAACPDASLLAGSQGAALAWCARLISSHPPGSTTSSSLAAWPKASSAATCAMLTW